MKYLIIINDAPYGTEKAYNALRLAIQLLKDKPDSQVWVFLMADAATCAIPNQITPNGYYNIERMLKLFISKGGKVKICGTCADARGLKQLQLVEGAELSSLSELSEWTLLSDKILVF
ncbi:MAG: DsrE family protein [Bacteroidetes bacterium]|nr:DsrE family protein [Bacteroidota bacterium]MBU1681069.1 DsrE family protein [Bacteroidota bacterium]MBU2507343.1 DsrE family protein [Bacteroidota bacterium]